jgi:hypothetical protein
MSAEVTAALAHLPESQGVMASSIVDLSLMDVVFAVVTAKAAGVAWIVRHQISPAMLFLTMEAAHIQVA